MPGLAQQGGPAEGSASDSLQGRKPRSAAQALVQTSAAMGVSSGAGRHDGSAHTIAAAARAHRRGPGPWRCELGAGRRDTARAASAHVDRHVVAQAALELEQPVFRIGGRPLDQTAPDRPLRGAAERDPGCPRFAAERLLHFRVLEIDLHPLPPAGPGECRSDLRYMSFSVHTRQAGGNEPPAYSRDQQRRSAVDRAHLTLS